MRGSCPKPLPWPTRKTKIVAPMPFFLDVLNAVFLRHQLRTGWGCGCVHGECIPSENNGWAFPWVPIQMHLNERPNPNAKAPTWMNVEVVVTMHTHYHTIMDEINHFKRACRLMPTTMIRSLVDALI